jgi:hypothetical protein
MKAYKVILDHPKTLERKIVVILATDTDGLKLQIAMQFPDYTWFSPAGEVYDVV